jgi:hypothetical protein
MHICYKKLGLDVSEFLLAHELKTNPETGTELEAMYDHAMAHGFPAEMKCWQTYKDLQRDFKRGVIILAMTADWGGEPGGHYAVIEDIEPSMIELADPGLPAENWPHILDKQTFLTKWFADSYPQSYLLISPKH